MANSVSPAVFGKRKEPHTIIIAQGDSVRHFTVRPWVAALAGSVLAAFVVGHLLATSYLVIRDDLMGAAAARQARTTQAYEDRISALRAQVDRITSRQLLDQQLMENKVAELLARQNTLSSRHGRLGPILERAGKAATAELPTNVPVPKLRPKNEASISSQSADHKRSSMLVDMMTTGSIGNEQSHAAVSISDADRADRLFINVNRALRAIEDEQLARLEVLAEDTYGTVDAIADALASAGLKIDGNYGNTATGGPLLPADKSSRFELKIQELDNALDRLDTVKSKAIRYPIANPAEGRSVSSSFGHRLDPILGRRAMHAGMDFRAPSGAQIRATGAGVVKAAGWNGGYGRMVEIDHGDGFTTRYAHMSRILVAKGQKIAPGTVLGMVGSSGRSTGPHLHYEVRRNGKALNPLRFIRAGRKISKLIES